MEIARQEKKIRPRVFFSLSVLVTIQRHQSSFSAEDCARKEEKGENLSSDVLFNSEFPHIPQKFGISGLTLKIPEKSWNLSAALLFVTNTVLK